MDVNRATVQRDWDRAWYSGTSLLKRVGVPSFPTLVSSCHATKRGQRKLRYIYLAVAHLDEVGVFRHPRTNPCLYRECSL